jgi:2,3-bisphosphoglycerate-independent phosphoglycerate mutase
MKYVILVGDGMGDYPIEQLNGRTPLQAANKPNMDSIARDGACGLARTTPKGMETGSDIANLSILGYDPRKYYTGRGPLEAAAIGVQLDSNDIVYRCNLITEEGGNLKDYSAGHISSEEGAVLVSLLKEKLASKGVEFYPGVSYRNLLVVRDGKAAVTYPPHDFLSQQIEKYLPEDSMLRDLTLRSRELLEKHEINERRRAGGKNAANVVWFWGGGKKPKMPSFEKKYGLRGSVISAVDLIKGIGIYLGLEVINVPGATGYIDTNYEGKASYALGALEKKDFVYLHVEATDEAAHAGDVGLKIKAIEDFDKRVVGRILDGMQRFDKYRILLITDHYTPISVRTHTNEPVPFAVFPHKKDGVEKFDEVSVRNGSFGVMDGLKLMGRFIK